MPAAQQLLFPDPQPLVDQLGHEFFRRLPEDPGVYLMRAADDTVLYVGKAKNLRKRIGSYRVANPDRLPRRSLRLLRSVARIEWQLCADEQAALACEAELLLKLRPRFNRAGTWPAPPRYLVWRTTSAGLELTVTTSPDAGWHALGPLRTGARVLRIHLVRLLWSALNPDRGFAGMPSGWAHGRLPEVVSLGFGANSGELPAQTALHLERLRQGQLDEFGAWIGVLWPPERSSFEKSAAQADLESMGEILKAAARNGLSASAPRLADDSLI